MKMKMQSSQRRVDPVELTFAHVDARALGIACGTVLGVSIFIATVILLIRGGSPVGPNLSLLGEYFIGYEVTWGGSLVGLVYGFVLGFAGGYSTAAIRNVLTTAYLFFFEKRLEDEIDELP